MNKGELRKEVRKLRDALSLEMRKEKSAQIAAKVIEMQGFQNANIVLLYSAMKSEVDTALVYDEAKRQDKTIYYPRVLGDTMEFYLADEMTEYETSRFGVCEPKIDEARRYVPKEGDRVLVIMPGLAFDVCRNRLGYGGGYYDKYLQSLEGSVVAGHICKVAVAYECQMVPVGRIEMEEHDICPDYVVTEKESNMENSYRYFENRACQYYPCHDKEHINCLFCYCPLNHMENCPGNPQFIEVNGKRIKDCSACTFPHEAENYDLIMKLLSGVEK